MLARSRAGHSPGIKSVITRPKIKNRRSLRIKIGRSPEQIGHAERSDAYRIESDPVCAREGARLKRATICFGSSRISGKPGELEVLWRGPDGVPPCQRNFWNCSL